MENEPTNAPRILLVEDDINLGFVVQDTLRQNRYVVHLCKDGKEGLLQFNKEEYDLCILDVMMPKKDGFGLAEDIRKTNENIPIIFLTAKSMAEDKVKGFKLGADDYITKPFSSEELVLRVKAILKRSPKFRELVAEKGKFTIGKYTFDFPNYELKSNGVKRKLTKKEAELLKLLCEHQGQVLERELLANMIWGDDSYFVGRSMDVFITKLRKYLSDDPALSISNVHGVGFRLEINS
ncbi:MAG: response regulator transcription factor [Crocinitomicaceae bacterium]|nr:response regulator transcription factor [Crocinitomicaceae bacterium]